MTPLTFRTCSNCASWRYPAPEEDVVSALCAERGERKRGGDKCSKWTRKEAEIRKELEPWDYFG